MHISLKFPIPGKPTFLLNGPLSVYLLPLPVSLLSDSCPVAMICSSDSLAGPCLPFVSSPLPSLNFALQQFPLVSLHTQNHIIIPVFPLHKIASYGFFVLVISVHIFPLKNACSHVTTKIIKIQSSYDTLQVTLCHAPQLATPAFLATTYLFSFCVILSFIGCLINGVTNIYFLYLASVTWHIAFEVKGVACNSGASFLLFNSIPLYSFISFFKNQLESLSPASLL